MRSSGIDGSGCNEKKNLMQKMVYWGVWPWGGGPGGGGGCRPAWFPDCNKQE